MPYKSQPKNLKKLLIKTKMEKAESEVQMKNTLGDLNNHLFAELERLGDEETKGPALQEEINRAKAIAVVSAGVIKNADLLLRARVAYDEADRSAPKPKMLEG